MSIQVTASTSVVLVQTSLGTPPYYVDIPNVSTTGRLLTVRDNDGAASTTNPIILRAVSGASFLGLSNELRINQPFGFMTFNTNISGAYSLLNTFAFPAGSTAAYVSNVNADFINVKNISSGTFSSSNLTVSSINGIGLQEFVGAKSNFTDAVITYLSAGQIMMNKIYIYSDIASNGIAIGNNAGIASQGQNAVAFGTSAGTIGQGQSAVAMGLFSGAVNQGTEAVGIGFRAGFSNQRSNAIAIGKDAGFSNQGPLSIALGLNAGQSNQGSNAIAIGAAAGQNNQHPNTIVLNASGTSLNTASSNGLFISPIRNDVNNVIGIRNSVYYNSITNEITTGPFFTSNFSDRYSTFFVSSLVASTVTLANLFALSNITAQTANISTTTIFTGTFSNLNTVVGEFSTMNAFRTNISTANIQTLNVITENASTINVSTLNVFIENVSTVNVITGNISTANILLGNISTTNISTANVITGNISTANILLGNISTTNISTANVITGNISTANILLGNISTTNISTANVVTGNISTLNATTAFISSAFISSVNILTTNVSSLTIQTGNIISANITSLTAIIENVTTANISTLSTYTLDVYNQMWARSTFYIGNSVSTNQLRFHGTTGDGPGGFSTTVIGERVYAASESSELLLFKGNDPENINGPDNIRMLTSGNFVVDVGTTVPGTFVWPQGGNPPTATYSNALVVRGNNGFVGLGTSTPQYTLDVAGSSYITNGLTLLGGVSYASLKIQGSATENTMFIKDLGTTVPSGWYIGESTGIASIPSSFGIIRVNNNNLTPTQGFVMSSNGNMGIGTTNPQAKVEIYNGTTNATTTLRIAAGLDGSATTGNISKIDFITRGGGGGNITNTIQQSYFGAPTNMYGIGILSNTTNLMTILNTGLVGIGTSNPTTTLDVRGPTYIGCNFAGNTLFVENNNTSGYALKCEMIGANLVVTKDVNNNTILGNTGNSGGLVFYTGSGSGTEKMRIALNGNMGIGTATPNYKLEVRQDIGYNNINSNIVSSQIVATSVSQNLKLGSFYTGGTGQICVVESCETINNVDIGRVLALNLKGGAVGINTSSPGAKLDVVQFTTNTFSTDPLFSLRNSPGSNRLFYFSRLNSVQYNGIIEANDMAFIFENGGINTSGNLVIAPHSSSATGIKILSNGNVGIGVASPSQPLDVNGVVWSRGNLRVGSDNNNQIRFYGTSGDGPSNFNHTVIGERIYGGTEQSELLIFKGNDPTAGSGPDRVRVLTAGGFFVDTTTGEGSWPVGGEPPAATTANAFTVASNGNVGIGVTGSGYKLDVAGSSLIRGDALFSNANANANVAIITESGFSFIQSGATMTSGSGNKLFFTDRGNTKKTMVLDTVNQRVGINGIEGPATSLVVGNGSITALTGLAVNKDDVNTVIGNYSGNVGSIQVTRLGSVSAIGTTPYDLYIQPLGGNTTIGGNLTVNGTISGNGSGLSNINFTFTVASI